MTALLRYQPTTTNVQQRSASHRITLTPNYLPIVVPSRSHSPVFDDHLQYLQALTGDKQRELEHVRRLLDSVEANAHPSILEMLVQWEKQAVIELQELKSRCDDTQSNDSSPISSSPNSSPTLSRMSSSSSADGSSMPGKSSKYLHRKTASQAQIDTDSDQSSDSM